MENGDDPVSAQTSDSSVQEQIVVVSSGSQGEDAEDERPMCLVCYDRPDGTKLECGHDQFCSICAAKFRTCPLCRRPLKLARNSVVNPVGPLSEAAENVEAGEPPIIDAFEQALALTAFVIFMVFLFFLGGSEMTDASDHLESGACGQTRLYIGNQCFGSSLTDLPPARAGGRLGGTAYFALIVCVQGIGVALEIALIVRLLKRGRMPRKELWILIVALFGEGIRMACVDTIMLKDTFLTSEAYRVLEDPSSGLYYFASTSFASTVSGMEAVSNSSDGMTPGFDSEACTLWGENSAVFDFPSSPGHRGDFFFKIGWFLGGGSAVIYLFATMVNEVADVIFVIPSTSSNGMLCKVFSVALEVFQLGCLLPFAIFEQGPKCLRYTAPLDADLFVLRKAVHICWYVVGFFGFTVLPLALLGVCLVCLPFLIAAGALRVGELMCDASLRRKREAVNTLMARLLSYLERVRGNDNLASSAALAFLLAFIPLLFVIGLWFGTLVIVGQLSKASLAERITAVSLLFDVLFKIGATAITETVDYCLHLRVRRRLEARDAVALEMRDLDLAAADGGDSAVEASGAGAGVALSLTQQQQRNTSPDSSARPLPFELSAE